MGARKSATELSDAERDAFLEAILRLKEKPAPGLSGFSVYDQFVALHGAVMGVMTPTSGNQTVNFGHGNIGFLPWHRQYLLAFEAELESVVSGVTVPYWNWADDVGAVQKLFTADFLSSRRWGIPAPVSDGVLRHTVPSAERPAWWPAGSSGYRIPSPIREGMGAALSRGSTESAWPPQQALLDALVDVDQSSPTQHAVWVFWIIIEEGISQLPQTHNAGHRFIGGHMGGDFSPNDPIFWLHHANVDRLWHDWQQRRIATGRSADHLATWPDPAERSPFDGQVPPEGHKLDDLMWPWMGGAPGYMSASVSQAVRNRLPDIQDAVRVRDMLDSSATGVSYDAPSP